ETFQVLTQVGLWKPPTWCGWKSYIYNLYTILVIFLTCGFSVAIFLHLVLISNTVENILDDIFSFLAMFIVCMKIFGLLRWHKEVLNMCASFEAPALEPSTVDEIAIEMQTDNRIRVYNDSEFIFSKVMFVQYSTSALLICTIVYLISQMGIFTTKFMGNAGSLIALTDLRLGINNTNWFALSVSAKRNIVFMMVRTLKPVVFTSGYMVTLSLESFKSLYCVHTAYEGRLLHVQCIKQLKPVECLSTSSLAI
ncbi:hypothetical protein PV326_013961, partial [Microctonus aethiopoides]